MLKCFFRLLWKYLSSDIEEAVERAFFKSFFFCKRKQENKLKQSLAKRYKIAVNMNHQKSLLEKHVKWLASKQLAQMCRQPS